MHVLFQEQILGPLLHFESHFHACVVNTATEHINEAREHQRIQ